MPQFLETALASGFRVPVRAPLIIATRPSYSLQVPPFPLFSIFKPLYRGFLAPTTRLWLKEYQKRHREIAVRDWSPSHPTPSSPSKSPFWPLPHVLFQEREIHSLRITEMTFTRGTAVTPKGSPCPALHTRIDTPEPGHTTPSMETEAEPVGAACLPDLLGSYSH